MRKDSPLACKEAVSAKDLWDLPLILSVQAMKDRATERLLERQNDRLNIAATYNLIYNASLLVEEGLGYALCLDKLIKITDDGVLCFRPLKPLATVQLDIVLKKNQVFSKAADIFLKRLYETFGN